MLQSIQHHGLISAELWRLGNVHERCIECWQRAMHHVCGVEHIGVITLHSRWFIQRCYG